MSKVLTVKNNNNMTDILRAVVEVTGISEADIRSKGRTREVVNARGIYFNVCGIMNIHPKICAEHIERDRSTAIKMGERYGKRCEINKKLGSAKSAVLSRLNIQSDDVEKLAEVQTEPIWSESHYIADMSSRYFGESYIGMEKGNPVCGGGFYKVCNEMIGLTQKEG